MLLTPAFKHSYKCKQKCTVYKILYCVTRMQNANNLDPGCCKAQCGAGWGHTLHTDAAAPVQIPHPVDLCCSPISYFLSTLLSIKSKKSQKIYLKKPPSSQQCDNRRRKFQLIQCIDFQRNDRISPQTMWLQIILLNSPFFLSSPERCRYIWQPSQSCIREQTLVFKTWELGHCKDKAVQSERSCTVLPWG